MYKQHRSSQKLEIVKTRPYQWAGGWAILLGLSVCVRHLVAQNDVPPLSSRSFFYLEEIPLNQKKKSKKETDGRQQ